MRRFSSKITFSIIAAGLFIVVSFAALNYENMTSAFYLVSGALVAFVFLFGFAMGHSHAHPVKELLQKAKNVTDGNLKTRTEVKTKDEIEELSKTFNKMAEGLEKTTSEAQTIKRKADINLKTKDIVSEKVIDALEEKIKNRTMELERVTTERDQLKKQVQDLQGQIGKKKK